MRNLFTCLLSLFLILAFTGILRATNSSFVSGEQYVRLTGSSSHQILRHAPRPPEPAAQGPRRRDLQSLRAAVG